MSTTSSTPRPVSIGTSVPRKEDRRLLTGMGRFTDDITVVRQVFATFLRSPHAHADIAAIDPAPALAMPGVLAVLTGRNWVGDGHGGLPQYANSADLLDPGKPTFSSAELSALPASPPIALDRVRHVGEIVAVVIAGTAEQALDAAEAIEVDYAVRAAVIDARAAAQPNAPRVWDVDNVCLRAERGDVAATAAAFAKAAHVVQLELLNQRVYGCPLEPRAAIATFADGRYTLQAPSQGVHRYKTALAAALGVEPDAVRVVTDDVGGGFGVRSACGVEYPLLLWAARRIARPVKWTAGRGEAFLSDFQARDVFTDGALALDAGGRILAARFDHLGNIGAHAVSFAIMSNLTRMSGGPYDIPVMHVTVRAAFTNTVPVSVYRGAGRPEITHVLERLIDKAARALGIDRAELRRRNLIPTSALPYRSALGLTYDSGAFTQNFDNALAAIDWRGFPDRRAAAAARGRLAGIGIATYLEAPGGAPHERTDIRVLPDGSGAGRVEAVIGTQSSGQGHATSFAQVVADALRLPVEQVSIVFGDSDVAKSGGGSHSDRSLRMGGTVLVRASEEIIVRGRVIAAHLLEAATEDVTYADGQFTVLGTDRGVSLFDVAGKSAAGLLAATSEITGRLPAFPNGVAACELEIDRDTGAVEIIRYVTVDDVGRVVNPMIVAGQIHGGIAQGIGQALYEHSAYDGETGQLIAGSFMDYGLPRADDLPMLACQTNAVPAPSNPLGVKGAGEAGTTPATAAVISAIVDALRDHGVTHIDMPATPERIWRAMAARRSLSGV